MFIAEKFLGHVPITRKLKRILLHIHNDYRNRVASGTEIMNGTTQLKYPIASRMREIIWDNELMYVAHVHTRQVRMGHDKCRNTQRYRSSGQNLVTLWEKKQIQSCILFFVSFLGMARQQ